MSTSAKSPAALSEQNIVELTSTVDSKIAGVAVYSHRAEVTRIFSVTLASGQNQIEISGLPTLLIEDSLRLEGKGIGIIQNVTISRTHDPPPVVPHPSYFEESHDIKQLRSRKLELTQAIERNEQSKNTLKNYMGSLAATTSIPFSKVVEITCEYDTAVEELHRKGNTLTEELGKVSNALSEKENAWRYVGRRSWNRNLANKVTTQIHADVEGEIELSLIYAVSNTSWSPRYDIRVNTHSVDKAISLVYKANVNQMSGEDWTDVPVTLETATPSFDKTLPTLSLWTIGAYRPAPIRRPVAVSSPATTMMQQPCTITIPSPLPPTMMGHMPPQSIDIQTATVSSVGEVSATFAVPGLSNIPSDGAQHTVTVALLELDAKLCWVSVPKKDAKTYLNAKIHNTSEHTLLKGPANVYIDGSFIARATIPAVNPEEKFECSLGIDPAVRITYHPLAKKLSQSGILSKSKVRNYTRRITVQNTKNSIIESVKIIDQIPVSEDSTITVKLLSPALQLPNFSSVEGPVSPSDDSGSVKNSGKGGLFRNIGASVGSNSTHGSPSERALKAVAKSVKVSPGVLAQWNRPDDEHESVADEGSDNGSQTRLSDPSAESLDLTALGKDGKISWLCSIPAQTKVNLTLQWEISAPVSTDIVGL